jgi:hypothetical protein
MGDLEEKAERKSKRTAERYIVCCWSGFFTESKAGECSPLHKS